MVFPSPHGLSLTPWSFPHPMVFPSPHGLSLTSFSAMSITSMSNKVLMNSKHEESSNWRCTPQSSHCSGALPSPPVTACCVLWDVCASSLPPCWVFFWMAFLCRETGHTRVTMCMRRWPSLLLPYMKATPMGSSQYQFAWIVNNRLHNIPGKSVNAVSASSADRLDQSLYGLPNISGNKIYFI